MKQCLFEILTLDSELVRLQAEKMYDLLFVLCFASPFY